MPDYDRIGEDIIPNSKVDAITELWLRRKKEFLDEAWEVLGYTRGEEYWFDDEWLDEEIWSIL